MPEYMKKNIARVRNCPDVTILNSDFGLCLLSFCPLVILSFCFVLSFCLFVFLFFCLFVFLSCFVFLSFCLFVFLSCGLFVFLSRHHADQMPGQLKSAISPTYQINPVSASFSAGMVPTAMVRPRQE